jgi:hypothetical protein
MSKIKSVVDYLTDEVIKGNITSGEYEFLVLAISDYVGNHFKESESELKNILQNAINRLN